MGANFNDAEYFADTTSKRVEHLINERNILRQELSRRSNGNLEQNKDFVRTFQESIISSAAASERIARLEYILALN